MDEKTRKAFMEVHERALKVVSEAVDKKAVRCESCGGKKLDFGPEEDPYVQCDDCGHFMEDWCD